jgi:hypothetical protein
MRIAARLASALAVVRQAGDPGILGPFRRRQDPARKATTLSLR